MAIAKVEKASVIYSDDPDVKSFAEIADLSCLSLADLPLPPEEPQQALQFGEDREQTDEQQRADDSEPQPARVRRGGDEPSEGQAEAEESGGEEAPS